MLLDKDADISFQTNDDAKVLFKKLQAYAKKLIQAVAASEKGKSKKD